ncbi:uncharacterized protein TNCV_1830861 [Trichonephila clavipes]|nr:uncharacterized protein TNCV_1830861 [Trichonephila clavipes]
MRPAVRRCCQEWVDNGRFQRHDGSGQPRATADREDRLIVRSAVTAPDSSLLTIRPRILPNPACLGYDGKATASSRDADDLSRQLEQICQEIPHETIRVIYHYATSCGSLHTG